MRLCRELVKLLLICENVNAVVRCDFASEFCNKSVRQFSYPMIPMSIHQIFSDIRVSLVKFRVGILSCLHITLDITDIHQTLLVRRELELADAIGNIAELCSLRKFRIVTGKSAYRSLPDLTALDIGDGISICPTGTADALSVFGKLVRRCPIDIGNKQVAASAVVLDGSVADSVENGFSVRRQLRVRKPAERKQNLRSHLPVGNFNVRRPDILCRLFFTITVHC